MCAVCASGPIRLFCMMGQEEGYISLEWDERLPCFCSVVHTCVSSPFPSLARLRRVCVEPSTCSAGCIIPHTRWCVCGGVKVKNLWRLELHSRPTTLFTSPSGPTSAVNKPQMPAIKKHLVGDAPAQVSRSQPFPPNTSACSGNTPTALVPWPQFSQLTFRGMAVFLFVVTEEAKADRR
jgi:hypothetical protein